MGADLFGKTLAGMPRQGRFVQASILLGCAALLAGCGTSSAPTPVVATPTVAVTSEELVGKWGLASYREETDKVRTEVAAKAACSPIPRSSSNASPATSASMPTQRVSSRPTVRRRSRSSALM